MSSVGSNHSESGKIHLMRCHHEPKNDTLSRSLKSLNRKPQFYKYVDQNMAEKQSHEVSSSFHKHSFLVLWSACASRWLSMFSWENSYGFTDLIFNVFQSMQYVIIFFFFFSILQTIAICSWLIITARLANSPLSPITYMLKSCCYTNILKCTQVG